MALSFLTLSTQAAAKPNLVLLPIDVSQQDADLEGQYGSALQEGLQKRYTVFYGAAVEKELEKEYSKIDCDIDTCNQNVAIAFNGELIADSEVKAISGGYLLKLVVRNVLTSEIIETKIVPCENCSQFDVIRQLKAIGAGTSKTLSSTSKTSNASSLNTDQRAILIFDTQPEDASISINGKPVGKGPYQGLNHKIGDKVKVEITKQYYRPHQVTLDLQQAITQLAPIVLKQGQGKLLIATKQFKAGAVIYVNGKAQGVAPKELLLPAGAHSIQIKAKRESTKVTTVTVRNGSSEQLTLEFPNHELNVQFKNQISEINHTLDEVNMEIAYTEKGIIDFPDQASLFQIRISKLMSTKTELLMRLKQLREKIYEGDATNGMLSGHGFGGSDAIPLVQIEPRYPPQALSRKIEGYVVLRLEISKLGSVKEVTVVSANPEGIFEREAIRAARLYRFKPKLVDGKPVAQMATLPFEFNLDK